MTDHDDEQQLQPQGPPVYLHTGARIVADPTSDRGNNLHPASPATFKLWRCIEALRNIRSSLLGSETLQAPDRKRRLVQVVTPFVSFCKGLVHLCNYLENPPKEAIDPKLTKETRDRILASRDEFIREVKFKDGPLKTVRDKMAAHVDSKLSSYEAQGFVAAIDATPFGTWLEKAILLLVELIQLEIYSWVADDAPEGSISCMNVNGSLVTFPLDEDGGGIKLNLLSIEIGHSPVRDIAEIAESVLEETRWMFPERELHLTLFEDSEQQTRMGETAKPSPFRAQERPRRNDPCWCGSGVKYKKCHRDQDLGR
jgi:hypothetical protein